MSRPFGLRFGALPIAALLSLPFGAFASQIFAPVLFEAIRSESGVAERTFGPHTQITRVMRQKMEHPGSVTIKAKVLSRFTQEGCARLQVGFFFDKALYEKKMSRYIDDSAAIELNTCLNGDPPVQGMDLRALQAHLNEDSHSPEQSMVMSQPAFVGSDGRVRGGIKPIPIEKESTK